MSRSQIFAKWLVGVGLLLNLLSPMPVRGQDDSIDQERIEVVLQSFQNLSDFVSDLQRLQQISSEVEDSLSFAESIVSFLDDMQAIYLPIVGSAWDFMIFNLNKASPGAGTALENLYQLSYELKSYSDRADSWQQTLQRFIAAVEAFEGTPSSQTLQELDAASKQAESALQDMRDAVAPLDNQVSEVLGSVEIVQNGFQAASDIKFLPDMFIEDFDEFKRVLSTIQASLERIEQDLGEIQTTIDRTQQGIDYLQKAIHEPIPSKVEENTSNESERSVEDVQNIQDIESIETIESVERGTAGILFPLVGFLVGVVLVYSLVITSKKRATPLMIKKVPASDNQGSLSHDFTEPVFLEVVSGSQVGHRWFLDKNDVLIGRGRNCNIHIPELEVSREHARLRYAQGAWFVQDQGSKIGTYLNGQLVRASRLKDGDRIEIGKTVMVFHDRLLD